MSDFSAGAGDTLSKPAIFPVPGPFEIQGLTAYARKYIFHSDSVIDTKSRSYSAGKVTAWAIQAAVTGGVNRAFQKGGMFNSNRYLRVGVGRGGPGEGGYRVFRWSGQLIERFVKSGHWDWGWLFKEPL